MEPGPITPVTRNCASGKRSPSICMNGMEPPRPLNIGGAPKYALDAFSYGTAIKKLYGAPVALENIALVTNTKLAKVPKTWAQLESQALATKKKTKAAVGISVKRDPEVCMLLQHRGTQ